jgi:hypothetical protein
MQKRALGYALILLGIITLLLKPITSITGFSIASASIDFIGEVWFFVVGMGMIIAGSILSSASLDERAYLWKDFQRDKITPGDIHGFRFYKNDMKRANEEAKRRLKRRYNPWTSAQEYLGEDGNVYSLDKTHYDTLRNKKDSSQEELISRVHFDVSDSKTGGKIDEVDIEGRSLSSKLSHTK